MQHKSPNFLAGSTSPYLLQHLYNPVEWHPWGEVALQKAKKENKLILVSIGYSACHWCHVMEHECFEDDEIAAVMNKFFICIKVDREERPDIDQIYMDAVQLMTGQGGWPLNCITLPNQKPLYGGTYFPKENWRSILLQVSKYFKENEEQCHKYANELTAGIHNLDFVKKTPDSTSIKFDFVTIVENWKSQFDTVDGGMKRSPKFPMPDNYRFLLQYANIEKDVETIEHIQLTLRKIALGGINDHLAGGFARYSTDMLWKIPHFEKMLYDNAQLVSLYAEAFVFFRDNHYLNVIEKTLSFINNHLTSKNGGFYSALDADTEGEEGKYYVWSKNEIESLVLSQRTICKLVYNTDTLGYWEEGNSVLFRDKTDLELATELNLKVSVFESQLNKLNRTLESKRKQRIPPGLDDKILCSWNAIMCKGYVDAFIATKNQDYIQVAIKNAGFITNNFLKNDGGLFRTCKDNEITKATIPGFLDDYSFSIEAFIALYTTTFDEHFLLQAKKWCEYVLVHFNDPESDLFFYTSDDAEVLINRKKELQDNVISSSNAVFAEVLFKLGVYFDNREWKTRARRMVATMEMEIINTLPWYSRWAKSALLVSASETEVVFTGSEASTLALEFQQHFRPNIVIAGCTESSDLPLTSNRYVLGKNLIYVCKNNSCHQPTNLVLDALKLINS